MTADLSALIARLEAAEVGSFALDKQILAALGFTWRGMAYWNSENEMWSGPSALTRSLDAALALAERVLEERGPININVCLAGSAQAQIYPVDPCGPHEQAVASTPALALCIAILRAKQGENT